MYENVLRYEHETETLRQQLQQREQERERNRNLMQQREEVFLMLLRNDFCVTVHQLFSVVSVNAPSPYRPTEFPTYPHFFGRALRALSPLLVKRDKFGKDMGAGQVGKGCAVTKYFYSL
jgi:hypothetical protein